MPYSYTLRIAGSEMHMTFRFPETGAYYEGYAEPLFGETVPSDTVTVPPEYLAFWQNRWNAPADGRTEFSVSTFVVCEKLLACGKAVFHGCAVLYHGKVILFTGPSGSGKTTQYYGWKELYGDDVAILNGDKPVLTLTEDGGVRVHPSPWKGKERLGTDDISAPLAAIIFLHKGPENHLRKMQAEESIRKLLGRILIPFADRESTQNACAFLDGLLRRVPVYLLENDGTPESAALTHGRLVREGILDEV